MERPAGILDKDPDVMLDSDEDPGSRPSHHKSEFASFHPGAAIFVICCDRLLNVQQNLRTHFLPV